MKIDEAQKHIIRPIPIKAIVMTHQSVTLKECIALLVQPSLVGHSVLSSSEPSGIDIGNIYQPHADLPLAPSDYDASPHSLFKPNTEPMARNYPIRCGS